jgi:hypothetical protein
MAMELSEWHRNYLNGAAIESLSSLFFECKGRAPPTEEMVNQKSLDFGIERSAKACHQSALFLIFFLATMELKKYVTVGVEESHVITNNNNI